MYNKKVLVTGCCGTVGWELVNQLLKSDQGPSEVIGIDNNESQLFFIDQQYSHEPKASFYLADIRDENALCSLFRGADIVFHTAAYKHVVLCERSPAEGVNTNILGVQNVINASRLSGVEKVIFTSSDKAVNPTSVMGTTKLMGERLISAANNNSEGAECVFASTRFGNVLGSNGSVVPIFKNQIKSGIPITLTDEMMTRFIMTVEEAARLVIDSANIARGGEVLITKMPVIRIKDLAQAMIQILSPFYGHPQGSIKIELVGNKPGEKLYEELMSDEEIKRAVELDNYFSVLPAYRGSQRVTSYDYENIVEENVTNPYNSAVEDSMSLNELKKYLLTHKLLEDDYGASEQNEFLKQSALEQSAEENKMQKTLSNVGFSHV